MTGKYLIQNIEILNECNTTELSKNNLHLKTKLNSKTGFEIIEEMFLVVHNNELRSITIRYENSIGQTQLESLYDIVNTIEITEPGSIIN